MPFDPEPFADGLRRMNRNEHRKTTARAKAAREEAKTLAERIGTTVPQVRRVLLFGSLLEETPKNPDFDIDLAVEGGDIYRAMEVCESSPWKVDLVNPLEVAASVAERIRETGTVLYEADS